MSSIEHIARRMESLDERPRAYELPPLGQQEYDALKASIKEHGVLVPVELTEDGVLLDGYQRWKISVELGMKDPPVKKRKLGDEKAERQHAVTLNLARRQMDPVTRAECVKVLAEARGLRLGGPGKQKAKADTLAAISLEIGISDRQMRRDQSLLKLPKEVREKVRTGDITARAALARADKPKPKPVLEPTGGYRAVIVEPDWNQSFNQIAKLKLEDGQTLADLIAADGCHLYLRVPPDHLAKGPALLSEWGLEYADCLTVQIAKKPGRYFTRETTHFMFGVRGEQKLRKGSSTLFTGQQTKDVVRGLVDVISDGPAIGLHVREDRWLAYDPITGDVLEPAKI